MTRRVERLAKIKVDSTISKEDIKLIPVFIIFLQLNMSREIFEKFIIESSCSGGLSFDVETKGYFLPEETETMTEPGCPACITDLSVFINIGGESIEICDHLKESCILRLEEQSLIEALEKMSYEADKYQDWDKKEIKET